MSVRIMPSNEKKKNRRKSIQSIKCKNKDEEIQIETNIASLPVRLGSGRVKVSLHKIFIKNSFDFFFFL